MEKEIKFWYLRNHQLFSQLTRDQYEDLSVDVGFRRGKKNERIQLAEDGTKRLYFLKTGALRVITLNEAGEETTIDVLKEGDIFGEISLNPTRSNTENEWAVSASEEYVICTFTLDKFEKALHKHPDLGLKYTKQVGDKLRETQTRFSDLIFKDVRTRLIDFLKRYALENGKQAGNTVSTKHFFTQYDISCLIGASRQKVTSLMVEFAERQLLEYDRHSYTILNLQDFH
jgi:CRP/FNR family cyclic AMP-dependent transcriptional regulator